jgi:hypothetical protein
MKLLDMQASRREFFRRAESRRSRIQGLVDLFQAGEIDVRRFRHLTALLKAEHAADCCESGVRVAAEFK